MKKDFERHGFIISTDKARLDIDAIHAHLNMTYWAKGIPRAVVEKSVANSMCFGIFLDGAQVGFARVITDCSTFAYMADVYVVEVHQGKGLAKWLVATIRSHPELQGLRRWVLVTRDAHGLYSQFGFAPTKNPERFMEIVDPDVYASSAGR